MFKNRNTQIIIGVLVVLLLVGGGYYFFTAGSTPKAEETATEEEMTIEKIDAKELGLSMSVTPDKKKVRFAIEKAKGITSLEYQITYEADSTAAERSEGGESRVERGITGEVKIKSGDEKYESEWLDLGSCSRNVCKYDSGVESVKLTLKINKDDGKIYEAEQTLEL